MHNRPYMRFAVPTSSILELCLRNATPLNHLRCPHSTTSGRCEDIQSRASRRHWKVANLGSMHNRPYMRFAVPTSSILELCLRNATPLNHLRCPHSTTSGRCEDIQSRASRRHWNVANLGSMHNRPYMRFAGPTSSILELCLRNATLLHHLHWPHSTTSGRCEDIQPRASRSLECGKLGIDPQQAMHAFCWPYVINP